MIGMIIVSSAILLSALIMNIILIKKAQKNIEESKKCIKEAEEIISKIEKMRGEDG